MANHQCPSSTSVVCCTGSLLVCRPRPKKALFEGHFSAYVSLRGLVTLRQQPQFQVATFCRNRRTHTDVRHPRLLHQLLIVGALFSNCASLQISLLRAVAECARVFCKLIFLAPGSIFTSGVSEAPASILAFSGFQAIVGASQAVV